MGRESKLRNPKPQSRYEYSNGDRKLYDRDAMPEGLDSDVWSLALYFEQMAEQNGFSTPGRPIIYTELYHRIAADPDLSELLRKDTSLTARTCVTGGIPAEPLISTLFPYDVLTMMIMYYWDSITTIDTDYNHSINDFCTTTNFSYLKDYVIETVKRNTLVTTGIREPQADRDVRPSRRTEEEKETFRIMNRPRTEEESRSRIERWKEAHTESS